MWRSCVSWRKRQISKEDNNFQHKLMKEWHAKRESGETQGRATLW